MPLATPVVLLALAFAPTLHADPMPLAPVTLAKDRPVLALPITAKKMVLAHFMPEFLVYKGNDKDIFNRTDLYDPDGPSAKFGGIHQYKSMSSQIPAFRDLDMVDAAAFEMKAALKLGVDGFQFYYPFVADEGFNDHYMDIVKAHFKAAERDKLPFKLTLCLSLGRGSTEAIKLEMWSRHINDLLAETRNSDKWAKTPDGRYLFYLYAPDAFSDAVGSDNPWADTPAKVEQVALSYERLAQACKMDIAYIYPIRFPDKPEMVEAALDWFPAVWDWIDVDPDASDANWRDVAARCKARHRAYTQTVHSDYYGSKLFDECAPKRRMMFQVDEILSKSMIEVMRDCEPTQLSYVFRQQLKRAIDLDVPLINYVTWNDWPEGHHMAPEINHNFGFPQLLQYYKHVWLHQEPVTRESAVLFYKKYAHDVKPAYFPVPYRLKAHQDNEVKDDFVEVITLLKQPAEVWFKGRKVGDVGPGLASTLVPTEPGMVHVQVRRGDKVVLTVDPPEGITDKPYRTDRLTYVYSSDCGRIFHELYGPVAMPVSDEYATDKDGTPNWKLRYKFWRDPASAGTADKPQP